MAFDPAIPNSATDDAPLRPRCHRMSNLVLTPNSGGPCSQWLNSSFKRGVICSSKLARLYGQIGHFGKTESIHSQSRYCSLGSGDRSKTMSRYDLLAPSGAVAEILIDVILASGKAT